MMRNLIPELVLGIAAATSASAADVVQTCRLDGGASNTVRVTRERPIADTFVYSLHYAGKTEYFFNDEENSRGGPVKVMCAGKKERVLVVYGEFTANYLQGFALVHNRSSGKITRLDFAEKGPPVWVYRGGSEVIVVAKTFGAGENGGKPYVAYRYLIGKENEPIIEGMDAPAPPRGFEAIKLGP